MKLKQRATIKGFDVVLIGSINALDFYETINTDREHFDIFIVQGENVLGTIDIECGMNQGKGFVESIEFDDIN